MTILDKIIADKIIEVAERKKHLSIDDLRVSPNFSNKCLSLSKSLMNSQTGIIAEFKRKSPSMGWIYEGAEVKVITAGYASAGAAGISVLTDLKYFGGVTEDLMNARLQVNCPLLRKDFIIDAYQLYEAKAMGADVILLIAAALTIDHTKELARKAHKLGLEVLLEIHNHEELNHIIDDVDIVGVNNRNLKTFEVNTDISFDLVASIPERCIKISESGLSSAATVNELRAAGFQGFLMGETFMRQNNPAVGLKQFIDSLS